MIDLKLDAKDLEKARRALSLLGDGSRPAIARAINRAVQGVATDAGQLVSKAYNMRSGDVKRSFILQRASAGDLEGRAISSGKVTPLDKFSPRPGAGGKRPPVGLSVLVMRAHGRQKVPGTFWFKGMVFKRTGAERFPVKRLFGPSVPQMLGNLGVRDTLQNKAADRFGKNLEHELGRAWAKAASK